jgi:hypothetical protein
MTVDLSVFDRLKTKADYDRAEEEFQIKKLAAIHANKATLPAALQIADEYAKARAAGDTQRMNDIAIAAKSFDKGVVYDQMGNPIAMGGYGDAVGSIEGAKAGYKEQAQKNVDLIMNPQIKAGETAADLQQQQLYKPILEQDIAQRKANVELGSAPKIEAAKKLATNQAEVETGLNENLAYLPQLTQTAQTLSDLGKKATYTMTGRAGDAIRNEIGGLTGMVKPSEGAVARTEYMNTVNNQILPLLRQTFGAQFTEAEGARLLGTLGDPNLTPDQKDAALKAFMDQKIATIQSKQRQTGQEVGSYENPLKANPSNIPMKAVQYLKANPQYRDAFDQKYGAGASSMVLGK